MELKGAPAARRDVLRLYSFLDPVNPRAAAKVMQRLIAAPQRLLEHPRLGGCLEEFSPQEVRRIFVGPYELRYQVNEGQIVVLRIWHGREDR